MIENCKVILSIEDDLAHLQDELLEHVKPNQKIIY